MIFHCKLSIPVVHEKRFTLFLTIIPTFPGKYLHFCTNGNRKNTTVHMHALIHTTEMTQVLTDGFLPFLRSVFRLTALSML